MSENHFQVAYQVDVSGRNFNWENTFKKEQQVGSLKKPIDLLEYVH